MLLTFSVGISRVFVVAFLPRSPSFADVCNVEHLHCEALGCSIRNSYQCVVN